MSNRKSHNRTLPDGRVIRVKESQTNVVRKTSSLSVPKPKISTANWSDTRAYKESKHISTGLEEDVKHVSARKDTKRWCKGVIGREHNIERIPNVDFNDHCFTIIPCGHRNNHWVEVCLKCKMKAYKIKQEDKIYKLEGDLEIAQELCNEEHHYRWVKIENTNEYSSKIRIIQECEMCGRTEGAYKQVTVKSAKEKYNIK